MSSPDELLLLFLGRVALVASNFPVDDLLVRTYVHASVSLSSTLWKNGGSDPDAVWHHRSDGSRDEAGSGVWDRSTGRGYFWGELEARHCNQWRLYGVRVRLRRDAALFPNYFGQTCYYGDHDSLVKSLRVHAEQFTSERRWSKCHQNHAN